MTESCRIICCSCRYNKTHCLHVEAIHHASKKPADLVPDCIFPFKDIISNNSYNITTDTKENYHCVSYKKIPFFIRLEKFKEAYSKRFGMSTTEEDQVAIAHLIPELGSCLYCNAEQSLMTQNFEQKAQIVLLNVLLDAKGIIIVFTSV